MELVSSYDQVIGNAELLIDAIHDGDLDRHEASELVARGKVFLPIRRSAALVFARRSSSATSTTRCRRIAQLRGSGAAAMRGRPSRASSGSMRPQSGAGIAA